MKFEGNPLYAVDRIEVNVINEYESEQRITPYAKHGSFTINSGDLIEFNTFIHECSHALQFIQSPWMYSKWPIESISTYTTYKTQRYIELHYPNLIPIVGTTNNTIFNQKINDVDELYEYSLEYWFTNIFDYGMNNNYSIGFAFAWFLDDVYGEYTKWITENEIRNPYYMKTINTNLLPVEEQIETFKLTYGDDIFDEFYTWLDNNKSIYDVHSLNLKDAEKIQIYPSVYSNKINFVYNSGVYPTIVEYNDLYIGFSAGIKYITEYLGHNVDELVLKITEGVVVDFYEQSGNLIKTEGAKSDKPLLERKFETYSLKGVSYIKLVGEGEFTQISISGFC